VGRHDAAVLALGRAAERFPDSGVVFAALGSVWLKAASGGDPVAADKAVSALSKAIELNETTPDTFALLGRARMLAGDFEGAERDLRVAVGRVPVAAEAFGWLADVMVRRRRWEEARDLLVRFAALAAGTPGAGAVAPRIGELSMRQGDPHAAAYWYERAVAETGPSAGLLLKQAEAEMSRGATARARQLAALGLELEPGHAGLRAMQRTLAAAR
jgi:predicted Zn-dependent protease